MNKGLVGMLSMIGGGAAGIAVMKKQLGGKVTEMQKLADKHLALYLMMNQWVKVKQDGKNLAAYFEKNEYKEIAIYGMSFAGETLVDELKGSDIKVKYGIDRNAEKIYADVDVITPDSYLEEVDAIVVTSITFFDQIERTLSERVDCPIISLEDVLYEV